MIIKLFFRILRFLGCKKCNAMWVCKRQHVEVRSVNVGDCASVMSMEKNILIFQNFKELI